jgi:hypothetical protein
MNFHFRMLSCFLMLHLLPLCAQLHQLSICAVFHNESRLLREWIAFHQIQGVEHFYIYDLQSDDRYDQLVVPYVAQDVATVIDWPFKQGTFDKLSAYQHCLDTYGKESRWIAFIDIDEFLFCPSRCLLTDFLKDFERFAGVGINRLNFGTSGISCLSSDSLFTESFQACCRPNHPSAFQIKSIVQPELVSRCLSQHHFEPRSGETIVNSKKKLLKGPISKEPQLQQIRINHYWTRDAEFFTHVKLKRYQDKYPLQRTDEWIERAKACETNRDTQISPWVETLKNQLTN